MTAKSNVRVRFAPSPTGYLHVGGARTLLFNYFYAHKTGGTLVLRIEDTDQARSTKQAEEMIMEGVKTLNMPADEGPYTGGEYGPYRQSERLAIYGKYAKELLERDQAYYCFCPDAELEKKRELAMKMGKTPHYDGTCAKIPLVDARARLAKGDKAGIRFRALQKDYILKDQVKGDVSFARGMVGDFFITRTPRADESEIAEGIGMPVYNFCCVIDDAAMKITHVIRGDDHLSNTARQLMIYDAFGWELPTFAHIAMVLGADKQKLSKRNGDSSVHDYMNNGYLPEALLNFLALLGWSPKLDGKGVDKTGKKTASGHPEIFSMEEMIHWFDFDGLQKAPAVFDVTKLQWMNGQYMRSLPLEDIASRGRTFFAQAAEKGELPSDVMATLEAKGPAWYVSMIDTIRGECALLSDLPKAAKFFFDRELTIEEAALASLQDPAAAPVREALEAELSALPEAITAEHVDAMQKAVQAKSGAKGKGLFMPIRSAITGRTHGPELKKVLPLLGKQRVMEFFAQVKAKV